MADSKTVPVTEQDIDAVEALLHELKGRAAQAHKEEKALLLGVYANLIKLVSPEVQRLRARIEREDVADFHRRHKGLKKAAREALAKSNGTT